MVIKKMKIFDDLEFEYNLHIKMCHIGGDAVRCRKCEGKVSSFVEVSVGSGVMNYYCIDCFRGIKIEELFKNLIKLTIPRIVEILSNHKTEVEMLGIGGLFEHRIADLENKKGLLKDVGESADDMEEELKEWKEMYSLYRKDKERIDKLIL
jgi:hypothetical protein